MTVQQLVDQLHTLNPDAIVILQKDSEGNGYSPLVGAEESWYKAENTYSGECYHNGDPDAPDGCVDCVVLWPFN